jgi:hypothetical protein
MAFLDAEVCDFDAKLEEKLDHRLRDFVQKVNHYKNTGYEFDMDLLQKQYNIDKNDMLKIKRYFQGRKLKRNYNSDMIQPEMDSFPSEKLHDPRLQKIKNKQQRDKEAVEQKNNYDSIACGYDMYRNDRPFASACGDDFKSRFNPQVWLDENDYRQNRTRKDGCQDSSDDDMDGYNFEKSNPNLAVRPNERQIMHKKRRYTNPNIYKNTPAKIRYDSYIPRGCNEDIGGSNYSLDSIIGKLDTYRDNLSNYHRQDEMDLDMKVSVPGNRCSNKREKENHYRAVPHMNGSKMRDVDIENHLCYGNGPSRGKKSLGYPNPAEHYFQYISDEVQRPEHAVFEPGMPTRMMNKDTARPYKTRDVM